MGRDLSRVLDAVLAGIVVIDETGRVELMNAAACRILGTSPEVAGGRALEETLGERHPAARIMRDVLETGRAAVQNEERISREPSHEMVLDLSASPLSDDGRDGGVALILRDRTIQKKLESVIADREQLQSFGRIAAGIAHEVKNPLGGIRGAAEILGSRATDPKTKGAAEMIVREVDRIAGLVDDLMVFNQGGAIEFAPVNIHRVLDDVIELLALDPVAEHIAVERVFDPSIPELVADGDRLTQVFLNLARNALQAMEQGGGTLVITTRMSLDDRLSTPDGRQLPTVVVDFHDTGPGIAPDALEKLATPFFTTRVGGTGLGLAVSRHWVSRHGGTLNVENDPGGGVHVRVALPLEGPA